MRPKTREASGSGDLYRSRLDQIINMEHELVRLAQEIDWGWIDGELAELFSDKGRPAVPTRFMVGLLLLKHIYGLSDEGVCKRWVHDPYFQCFTGEEFFQHTFPHKRSGLTHWRRRLGNRLEVLLAESLRLGQETRRGYEPIVYPPTRRCERFWTLPIIYDGHRIWERRAVATGLTPTERLKVDVRDSFGGTCRLV